ncbi:hypothetical protein E2C01_078689 [Portunus trituberculatus]|uniref:Uncharacterized protein n=1 Tax=Portunus trituberculatus TaxID=210409 RepID=A0A5B7IQU0_PORTR|nr:hypothetical protein [Portunus trituberculatus]
MYSCDDEGSEEKQCLKRSQQSYDIRDVQKPGSEALGEARVLDGEITCVTGERGVSDSNPCQFMPVRTLFLTPGHVLCRARVSL